MKIVMLLSAILSLSPDGMIAQDQGLVARWSFEEEKGAVTRDSISGAEDKIEGFFKYVPGISGSGLLFDGYTTSVVRKASNAPKLTDGFSVEAWVALNSYPWNWVPVVSQDRDVTATYRDARTGYFFGIDGYGHLGLQASVDAKWQSLTSTVQIPLKRWAKIAGTYDSARGLAIYLDGKEVGSLAVSGSIRLAPSQDLLIGRVRQPILPTEWLHPKYPVWYSLDGILDEIGIYNRSLSPDEVARSYGNANVPKHETLAWPVLPSGPAGPGRFGAYYASLKYEDTWDRLRRTAPESDVVVRFDVVPIKFVFWQGTNYVPVWVTENNKWYTDYGVEISGVCPGGQDCEPMSDKQTRYSRVQILENTDARAVVHWRYALADVEHYQGASPDPLSGWFDWVDEYYIIDPDGIALRKQVLRSSKLITGSGLPHRWQQTIVINQPGTRPEDNIEVNALTLGSMAGDSATYFWLPETPRSFDKPYRPNIQIVNLKSKWKPFQIVPPTDASIMPFARETPYSIFNWWNHWPVAQIASSGVSAFAADRPSHTGLSSIKWRAYKEEDDLTTKIVTELMLVGLTTNSVKDLIPLARSWLSPAEISVLGDGFRSEGYDIAERAFILSREKNSRPVAVKLALQAKETSPVINPTIVIKDWGEDQAKLEINGKPVAWGASFRHGHVRRLDGTDLVVWIREESWSPINISLTVARQ